MEIWTVVISMWLTTWFMAVSRTYSIIMRMISNEEGGKLIRDYKNTHAFIYAVSMIFIDLASPVLVDLLVTLFLSTS